MGDGGGERVDGLAEAEAKCKVGEGGRKRVKWLVELGTEGEVGNSRREVARERLVEVVLKSDSEGFWGDGFGGVDDDGLHCRGSYSAFWNSMREREKR